jgi:hypothetical protein
MTATLPQTDRPPRRFTLILGGPAAELTRELHGLRAALDRVELAPNVRRAALQVIDEVDHDLSGTWLDRGLLYERIQGLVRLLHGSGTLVRTGPELVRPIQRLVSLLGAL